MTSEERFWSKVQKTDYCWIWTGAKARGYGHIGFNKKVVSTHRFSFEIHKCKIPRGLYVLHCCDNRLCVNPDHLFLGTHRDNMQDMARKGRTGVKLGENHWKSKLTDKQIAEIRQSKLSLRKLANIYGVCFSMIGSIKNRKNWKHI